MTYVEEQEEWRGIVGFKGRYEVSSLGRVRSLTHFLNQKDKGGNFRLFRRPGKLLKPGIASNGYPTVAIGKGNTRTCHSLVAEAFIGPCPSGKEVRHKDGCRLNPRATNLEYGTRTENIYDAIRHGTWNRSGPVPVKAWKTRRQRYGSRGSR